MKMERKAEIIRGWPYDGARDRVEPIKAATTLVNGDWVAKETNGTVAIAADSAKGVGLVVVGNGDSSSAASSGKAVVLWGNYIAKISNFDTAATYVPGGFVKVAAGKLTSAATAAEAVGTVVDVVAAGADATAHIVVDVK